METKASSSAEPVKRPIDTSNDGDKSVSSSKKIKVLSTGTSAVNNDEPLSNKEGKISKKNKPEAKSQNQTDVNVLKRLSDVLLEDNQCLSPSKKRKFAKNQGASGENLDKRSHCKDEIEKRKNKRMKNKALFKTIVDQMEFYFSDSNLSKDRFLRKLYNQSADGYVDLSVFSNFNKLQSLLKGEISLNVLCKALATSKLLEVNEDHTKVRRRTPLVELDPEEVNKRTVYVEHLPNHASHAWIRKIFSQCGRVCYVSLPVYQTSKEIKGFAFVEFGSSEEAEKACAMLNNPPPTKTEEKPGKFPKGNKFLYRVQKIVPSIKVDEQDSNEENLQSDSKEDQTISPTKKKKKKNVKRKIEDYVEKQANAEQSDSQDEKKKKKKKKKRQATVAEGEQVKEKDISEIETIKTEGAVNDDKNSEASNTEEVEQKNKDKENITEVTADDKIIKKKTKKKKRKKSGKSNAELGIIDTDSSTKEKTEVATSVAESDNVQSIEKVEENASNDEVKLSRMERKRLRQEDIRRKKVERERKANEERKEQNQSEQIMLVKESETQEMTKSHRRKRLESVVSESSETEDSCRVYRKSDGSQLTSCLVKSKKQDVVKKVEFDPVPITTEFVERKEVRKRKKQKRESLHLRVLSKKEWLSLREEYINQQKSHMAALKESLRELRMQECVNQSSKENNAKKHVDLTNVFGTKRMKPSQDVKLAHLEELKFIPNVIVQWKCSHEINRNKIKTMFKEISSDRIAYIEGKEEAKSGYIRFKDERSAEEFARLSRSSDSFSARVLPESQQAAYWEKANKDRVTKLSKKKNERGTDRIARKVFERNKVTFHEKGSHIVFDNDDADDDGGVDNIKDKENDNSGGKTPHDDNDITS